MSTLVWNARGLGGRRAFLFLQQLVAELRPLVLFVSESKVSCNRAYQWLSALNFHGVIGSDPRGSRGGLLLFWNKNVDVYLRSYSFNHINVYVCWNEVKWCFTGCYAPSNPYDRIAFWDLLLKLNCLRGDINEPWLLGGDFNEIRFESEKTGGNKWREPRVNNFSNCCQSIGLQDVKWVGSNWTWTNGRKGKARIKERLDRFVANKAWMNLFPRALSTNCGFYSSDHRAVKLNLNFRKWVPKKTSRKPFVFENKWTLEEDFTDNARTCWEAANKERSLPEKLRKCGELVSEWGERKVGNTKKKI